MENSTITELRLDGQDLLVVDAMNFRVQVLDHSGKFEYAVGQLGDGAGQMFRPKGISRDSEGHLYVVEGLSVWCRSSIAKDGCSITLGRRLGFGEFQLPTGLFIDRKTTCVCVDSYIAAVQVLSTSRWERDDPPENAVDGIPETADRAVCRPPLPSTFSRCLGGDPFGLAAMRWRRRM